MEKSNKISQKIQSDCCVADYLIKLYQMQRSLRIPHHSKAVFCNLLLSMTCPTLTMAHEGTAQNSALQKGAQNNTWP
jgi:hypothetical protein